MEHVIIGVDPHKLSATIEVVDQHEQMLGSGRFTTDRAGYAVPIGVRGRLDLRISGWRRRRLLLREHGRARQKKRNRHGREQQTTHTPPYRAKKRRSHVKQPVKPRLRLRRPPTMFRAASTGHAAS